MMHSQVGGEVTPAIYPTKRTRVTAWHGSLKKKAGKGRKIVSHIAHSCENERGKPRDYHSVQVLKRNEKGFHRDTALSMFIHAVIAKHTVNITHVHSACNDSRAKKKEHNKPTSRRYATPKPSSATG